MYKLILICAVCLIFTLAGCSSTTSPNYRYGGVSFLTNFRITYVNENGENLLNPDHPHAITEQNTNLYFWINGKKKKIYRPRLAAPKSFLIGTNFDSSGDYEMMIYPNIVDGQNTAITYITFKNYPTDTLKVQYITGHGATVTKAWYNGELRWDVDQGRRRMITITKHLSVQ